MDGYLAETPAGVIISILVQPRAAREEVAGFHLGRLKIRLTAPPVEGQANKALINFLAKKLKIAKSRLSLISGQTGRKKDLLVEGLGPAEIRQALEG